MKESDFIYKGYNKFNLWFYLWYQEMTSPQNEDLTPKEIKNRALRNYLQLLGFKQNGRNNREFN